MRAEQTNDFCTTIGNTKNYVHKPENATFWHWDKRNARMGSVGDFFLVDVTKTETGST